MKPKLDDLVIPAEIRQLTDVTPAGKLLLAMCYKDPRICEWRLRLALSITHNGLRKLRRRLSKQGLIVAINANQPRRRSYRVKIAVQSSAGHLVSAKNTVENGQKVAGEGVDVYGLTIPGEILSLRDVMAAPKLILTLYARSPLVRNEPLAAELGLSLSGLKKARQQLIAAGLLVQSDGGYAPEVPGIIFTEAGGKGHFVPDLEARKGVEKVTTKFRSIPDIVNDCDRLVAQFCQLPDCAPAVMEQFCAEARQRILNDFPDASPQRDHAVNYLTERANLFFAGHYVLKNCRVRKQRLECFKVIGKATAAQLQIFRERAEPLLLNHCGPRPNVRQLLAGA